MTNPPIDSLREGLVMSLQMRLGKRGNLLQPGPDAYSQVQLWRNCVMLLTMPSSVHAASNGLQLSVAAQMF